MNRGDVASAVVNKSISRLVEQERAKYTLTPIAEFGELPPGLTQEQLIDHALWISVLVKISMTAGMN